MKHYHVTRKLQVTIPKRLAARAGITPGDSVIFDESDGEITLRKAGRSQRSASEMMEAMKGFTHDLERIAPGVREARRALDESLSGHVGSR